MSMNSWAVKLNDTYPLHGPFGTFRDAERFAAGYQAVTIYRMVSPTGDSR